MNIIIQKRKKGPSGPVSLNKKKVATVMMVVFVVLPATFLFAGYKLGIHYVDSYGGYFAGMALDSKEMSKHEKLNKPYESMFISLGDMQKSLDGLQKFISISENKLKIEQQALEHMINQKQTLKPLLQADQDVVDAMFSIQHQKYEQQKLSDRLKSFVVGVVASIIAAFIYSFLQKRYKVVINADVKRVDEND